MQIRLWMVALAGLILNILFAHEIVSNAEFAAGTQNTKHALGAFSVALESEFWTLIMLFAVASSHGLVCLLDAYRPKRYSNLRDLLQAMAGLGCVGLIFLLVADIFLTVIAGQGMEQQVGVTDAPTVMPLVMTDFAILAGIGWCFMGALSSKESKIFQGE